MDSHWYWPDTWLDLVSVYDQDWMRTVAGGQCCNPGPAWLSSTRPKNDWPWLPPAATAESPPEQYGGDNSHGLCDRGPAPVYEPWPRPACGAAAAMDHTW